MLFRSKELEEQKIFEAFFATEDNTKEAIKSFYEKYNYVIDPHTAVGYYCNNIYKNKGNDNFYNVVLSTASPYKFSESVLDALELKSSKILKEQIKLLKKISPENYDKRVEEVLNTKIKAKVLSVEETFEYVKKVIGDIDDQN